MSDQYVNDKTGYSDEQEARDTAVKTAAYVLQGSANAKFATPGDKNPGTVQDIIDLAEYIVSGDPYSVKQAKAEQALFPQAHIIPLRLDVFGGDKENPDSEEANLTDDLTPPFDQTDGDADYAEGATPEGTETREAAVLEDPFLADPRKDVDPIENDPLDDLFN